jgi:hypothetical protein
MKKIQWWIASYKPNLLQQESFPVGVILLTQEKAVSRFLDDKEASALVSSLSNYAAWVDYWQYRLEEPTPNTLRELLINEPDSNYLVKPAGESTNLGTSEEALLSELYESLVYRPLQTMKSERALVGRIVGLSISGEHKEQRIATLQFEEKGQQKQTQLSLDEEQYKTACDALRDELWVEVRGFSEPNKPSYLQRLTGFQIIQPQSTSAQIYQPSHIL